MTAPRTRRRVGLKSAALEADGTSQHFAKAARPTSKSQPFSIRLSDSERRLLAEQAGDVPLGTYVKDRVLARKARSQGVASKQELATVLALLGKEGVASSLRRLADASRSGSLMLTPDVERELTRACASISEIRDILIVALGLRRSG